MTFYKWVVTFEQVILKSGSKVERQTSFTSLNNAHSFCEFLENSPFGFDGVSKTEVTSYKMERVTTFKGEKQ
jgi:hypothetical protein